MVELIQSSTNSTPMDEDQESQNLINQLAVLFISQCIVSLVFLILILIANSKSFRSYKTSATMLAPKAVLK